MIALLWKDLRLSAAVALLGLFTLTLPYLLFAVDWVQQGSISETVAYGLCRSAQWSLALSLLTTAVLGGNAIACERLDGSIRFLAYLPPSRLKLLASKLLVSFAILAAIWLPNAAVVIVASQWWRVASSLVGDSIGQLLWILAAITVLLFGVAWLLSSLMTTTGLPAILAILVQLMVLLATAWWPETTPAAGVLLFSAVEFAIGIAGIAVGSLIFLFHVED